jgi:hypothetical protein
MVMEKTRRPGLNWQRLGLRVAGAGLLAVTGATHLDLYLTGYRSIPVIGWLFLLQVIAALGLAAAVLVSGSRLAAAAGAGFVLSTLGGYLLSVWFGLFGFKEVRTTAGIVAGVIEVAAFAVLAVLALSPATQRHPAGPVASRSAMLARLREGVPGCQGGDRRSLGCRPGAAGRRRCRGGRPGTFGRRRPEDGEDRRRDRTHQRQGVHAVLLRPRYPVQIELQRGVRCLLAACDRDPGRRPGRDRQAGHDQAVRRRDAGHLRRASPVHLHR